MDFNLLNLSGEQAAIASFYLIMAMEAAVLVFVLRANRRIAHAEFTATKRWHYIKTRLSQPQQMGWQEQVLALALETVSNVTAGMREKAAKVAAEKAKAAGKGTEPTPPAPDVPPESSMAPVEPEEEEP